MKIIKSLSAILAVGIAVNFAVAHEPDGKHPVDTRAAAACGPNECAPSTYDASCQCCAAHASPAKTKPIRIGQSAPASDRSPNTSKRTITAPEPFNTPTMSPRRVPRPRATSILWESDIRKAAIRSSRDGKPMLLNVSADWCHFCTKMKHETYTQRQLIDQINDQFVAVDLDADANRQLVQLLGIKSLPTVLLVTPDIKVVTTMTGFQSADELTHQLNQVAPRIQRRSERINNAIITVSRENDIVVE